MQIRQGRPKVELSQVTHGINIEWMLDLSAADRRVFSLDASMHCIM
jgi:hypothetical protein